MYRKHSSPVCNFCWLLALLAVSLCVGLPATFAAQPDEAMEPRTLPAPREMPNPLVPVFEPTVIQEPVPQLVTLAEARAYALANHPTLKAYHASLRTAEIKLHSLQNIHRAVSVVRRDLPVRQCQARKGIAAAQAQLRQAQWDVLYGVTRMYFTAVYAMEQIRVAENALDPKNDKGIRKLRELLLDPKNPDLLREDLRRDLKEWDKDDIEVVIKAAEARLVEAKVGKQRALAGLREAMGLEDGVAIVLSDDAYLPDLRLPLTREGVVSLAKHHRGEIVQSQIAYDVVCLEVTAQGKILGLTGQTFAAGSDLHAQPVPIGEANGDYRPGAVGLEMPTTFVGSREDRQAQAASLKDRAGAVIDKTRHLVTLQAEDVYLKWSQAAEEYEKFQKASDQAKKMADLLSSKFDPGYRPPTRNLPFSRPDRPTLLELLNANIRSINLRLRTNQALYDTLVGLVGIERATAGGIQPGFDQPLPMPEMPEAKPNDEKKNDNDGGADDPGAVSVPDLPTFELP